MALPEPLTRKLLVPFALGCSGLGFVGLIFRDFAPEPVRVTLPMHGLLALLSSLLLVGGGALLWPTRTRVTAATTLCLFFVFWLLALHVPGVARAPENVATWLGLCEIGAFGAGALAIVGSWSPSRVASVIARIWLGGCAVVFGVSHFAYAEFTAGMVPTWVPGPLWWAYATGAGHVLAGASLLTGIQSRLAASVLAAMCGAFVLLLHLPRVVAHPSVHAEWTMLFTALTIAGAALATAAAPERRDLSRRTRVSTV